MNLQESFLNLAAEVFPPVSSPLVPMVVERGEGPFIWDIEGKKYIDFATGIAVAPLGHCHPKVVQAIQRQAENLLSSVNFLYPQVKIELGEKLAKVLPGNIDNVFLCNSGTEAMEGALKLARKARPGRPNFLAFNGGFHGRTFGALSVTASKASYRNDFFPLLPNCYFVDYPHGIALSEVVQQIEKLFEQVCPPNSVAAIVVEPILGEGGYAVPPNEFLPVLRRICDRWEILLICDEVQTGFGRTGRWFACEHTGVLPDILTFAKGVASGLPLGGFAANKELMSLLKAGSHGSTFGGNPVCCAAALATLQAIESEELLIRAASLGASILERLQEKFGEHLEIRGKGLMIALEPRPSGIDLNVKSILQRMQSKGLIALSCGKNGNVLRLIPPLNVPDSVLNQGINILEQVIDYEIMIASEAKRYQALN